jgi:hypothetical protein
MSRRHRFALDRAGAPRTNGRGRTIQERIDWSREVASALPLAAYSVADRHRDFRETFSATEQGRRVLAQILSRCRLWDRSYAGEATHETAFREGNRDIGLWLMGVIEAEPLEAAASADNERNPA